MFEASADHAALWCCPRCRDTLLRGGAALYCAACGSAYPVIGGIPDLRIDAPAWIDVEEDRARAREFSRWMQQPRTAPSLATLIREVFRGRDGVDDAFVDLRVRQILAAPARLGPELRGWLRQPTGGLFLDLGCGPGMLLAAAAQEGRVGIGIDVCLAWLVVARHLVERHGGRPLLAAAFAEALPLRAGAVDAAIALDVVEHVADPVPFLREADRVTSAGGHLALATPNRFSLAPEPHVGVWGVGWLPRRWQKPYVRLSSGKPYEFVRLLSSWELRRLVRQHTGFVPELLTPPVPDAEIARFPVVRATLARTYNAVVRTSWSRPATLAVGPFFRVVGCKRDSAAAPVARAPQGQRHPRRASIST